MDVNEWMSYECLGEGKYVLRTFITHLLVRSVSEGENRTGNRSKIANHMRLDFQM